MKYILLLFIYNSVYSAEKADYISPNCTHTTTKDMSQSSWNQYFKNSADTHYFVHSTDKSIFRTTVLASSFKCPSEMEQEDSVLLNSCLKNKNEIACNEYYSNLYFNDLDYNGYLFSMNNCFTKDSEIFCDLIEIERINKAIKSPIEIQKNILASLNICKKNSESELCKVKEKLSKNINANILFHNSSNECIKKSDKNMCHAIALEYISIDRDISLEFSKRACALGITESCNLHSLLISEQKVEQDERYIRNSLANQAQSIEMQRRAVQAQESANYQNQINNSFNKNARTCETSVDFTGKSITKCRDGNF